MTLKTSAFVVLVALALSACGSYQPFDYVDTNTNIVGPGAFTGEDGEWVIYRKK